jgi:N-acetyl-gamma-glutamyl-phosphate reductase
MGRGYRFSHLWPRPAATNMCPKCRLHAGLSLAADLLPRRGQGVSRDDGGGAAADLGDARQRQPRRNARLPDGALCGSPVVKVHADMAPSELLILNSQEPSDRLDLYVMGSPKGDQVRLMAMLDNLGKGASGAAVQNLNIMAGLDEVSGLRL